MNGNEPAFPTPGEQYFKDEPAKWSDVVGAPGGYPIAMQAALLLGLNRRALAWIDKNRPKAFYRELFADPAQC